MGIQPIDLQVMYQQSANVSKMAGNVQAAQLADSIMQQTTVVQQNMENARRVHSANDDKAKNTKIDNEKSGGGNGAYSQKKENQNKEDDNQNDQTSVMTGPKYLGSIIDIVG